MYHYPPNSREDEDSEVLLAIWFMFVMGFMWFGLQVIAFGWGLAVPHAILVDRITPCFTFADEPPWAYRVVVPGFYLGCQIGQSEAEGERHEVQGQDPIDGDLSRDR